MAEGFAGLGLDGSVGDLASTGIVRTLVNALAARRRARLKIAHRRARAAADQTRIARYVAEHEIRKLQIGCSGNLLPDWLNSDLEPTTRDCIRLDAGSRFPLPDATFDVIFSEHLIEHLTPGGGRNMLSECARILRRGGRVRIACPDLSRIVALCSASSDANVRYLRLFSEKFLSDVESPTPVHTINHLFREWGHRFLYDEPTLAAEMSRAGFQDIRRVGIGESTSEHLCGLERHGNIVGVEMNEFETMVLEARRP